MKSSSAPRTCAERAKRVYRLKDAEYQYVSAEVPFPASSMPSTVTFDLRRDPTAPSHARRAIEGLPLAPDVTPDVKLLVSELITNSVKYGGNGAVTLKVRAEEPRRLRVEVIDQGAGFVPVARNRPATDVGGWGLHLVQTLSDRWGVYEGSTHVWFEIDRTPSAVA